MNILAVAQMTAGNKMLLEQILSHFPQRNLKFAFAYGSGVFQQRQADDPSKNMVDFVFAVDNSTEWHRDNMKRNRSHYSFLKHVGPRYLALVQDNYGARVYYNALVPCEGRLIKYGVIERSSLINDLLDWESLYVSGRLHKPVAILHRDTTDVGLSRALVTNLQSAVHAALLLLPDEFSEETLFMALAGLSYSGDFRMKIGAEDRFKVRNIVRSNIEQFRRIYENVLTANEEHLHWNRSVGRLERCGSATSLYHHLNLLPKWLMYAIVNQRSGDGRHRDTEEVLRILASDGECAEVVQKSLTGIIHYSSIAQSLKGLVTAGPLKSLRYGVAKLRKGWKN